MHEKLRDAMIACGATTEMVEGVLSKLRKTLPEPDEVAAPWEALLAPLRAHLRSMQSNMHNRAPATAIAFESYLGVLKKVKEQIEVARLKHVWLPTAIEAAAQRNAERMREGRPAGATCGPTWQSWVPDSVRTAVESEFTKAYESASIVRTRRFKPFVNPAAAKNVAKCANLLRTTLERIRGSYASTERKGKAATPYRALWLCAARMAERELDRRLKLAELEGMQHLAKNPLPVNWLALLDAPMRRRLRDAAAAPDAVSPAGLEDFYAPELQQTYEQFDAEFAGKDATRLSEFEEGGEA